MKFNFWQKIDEIFFGKPAGDANYRAQSDAVKAAAPALIQSAEQAITQAVVQKVEAGTVQKVEAVLPLGGLTATVLGDILGK